MGEVTMEPESSRAESTVHLTTATAAATPTPKGAAVFTVNGVDVSYGSKLALKGVDMTIYENQVTAFIGPSGCGKSTYIRCFNRMNDLIPGAAVSGEILYHGQDLYGSGVDPVQVRRLIGMVFQKPNPFVKSIYENVAYGPRVLGMKKDLDERSRALASPGGALGRGEGSAQGKRSVTLGWPAAAALHRTGPRGGT